MEIYVHISRFWLHEIEANYRDEIDDLITFAALVLALAHRETAVSGFSTLKNDTELCSRDAKSNAFHLQSKEMKSEEVFREVQHLADR